MNKGSGTLNNTDVQPDLPGPVDPDRPDLPQPDVPEGPDVPDVPDLPDLTDPIQPPVRGGRGLDARESPEKLKENRGKLRVDDEHKTPEMQKDHRGTFP